MIILYFRMRRGSANRLAVSRSLNDMAGLQKALSWKLIIYSLLWTRDPNKVIQNE